MNVDYIVTLLISTVRLTTPILLVALTASVCSKVGVFNIGLEGTMLAGAFVGIVTNYYTHNLGLSLIFAGLMGSVISFVIGALIIKLKAVPMIVGFSTNMLLSGTTTFLMTVIWGSKGTFYDSSLKTLPMVALPIVSKLPVVGRIFSSLNALDYFAVLLAVLLYVFMYKTVIGFRLRAIGINKTAARSLGTNTDRFQFLTVICAGAFAGLGGALLTVGSSAIFIRDITGGRGYIALAANTIGCSHPLGVLAACFIFGIADTSGDVFQGTAVKSSILETIPYVITIVALVIINIRERKNAVKTKRVI